MRFPFFKFGADKPVTIKLPEDVPCSVVVFVPGDGPELDADAINKMTAAWIDRNVDAPLKELVKLWMQLPVMQVRSCDNDELGRQLYEQSAHFGYTKEEAAAVCEAPRAYVVTGRDPLVLPRTGTWAALCTGLALAELPGTVMLDGDRTKPWNTKLTFDQLQWKGTPRLKEFILVPYSQAESGLFWFTTVGMGRFGLPEIQVEDVPEMDVPSLVRAICGVGQELAELVMTKVVESGNLLKKIEIGPELALSEDKMRVANGFNPADQGQQKEDFLFRLSLRRPKHGGAQEYLTLLPPASWKGDDAQWLSALASHFGLSVSNVQKIAVDDPLLARVKEAAHADLPRFLELFQQQPPDTHFSIKVPITEPNVTEHLWMSITRIEKDRITGRIENDPVDLTTFKCGDEATTTLDAIEDLVVFDAKSEQIVLGGHYMKAVQAVSL